MFISYEFISGVMLGFEHVSKQMMGEDSEGWYLILDLLIVRILIEREV